MSNTVKKPVIALIGGIGSGKSRVAAEFERLGGCVIAGDQLGHEALRQTEIRDAIVHLWGVEVLAGDGPIDRSLLGKKVFADPKELRKLEALVHPWIRRRFMEEIARAENDVATRFIVIDAAVLLEAGWNTLCDRIVYVHTPRSIRLQRLAKQRGWNTKEVEARERAQLPLSEKLRRADAVVDNSGSAEEMARQVVDLLKCWGMAIDKRPSADRVDVEARTTNR